MFEGLDTEIFLWAGGGAIIVLLLLLLIYIGLLNYRLVKLQKKYTFFMQDEIGQSLEAKLHADVAELQELRGSLDLMHSTQKDILSMQNQCFRKIGFVKYNAFDNIGNNLSFAFTILDGKNDGFCLSSVYGRNESRIFAKPIIDDFLKILPDFQQRNWTLAYCAVEKRLALDEKPSLPKEVLEKSVHITIPGRLEKRNVNGVNIIFDVAHNPQKIRALIDSLRKLYPDKKPIFVVAFGQNKHSSLAESLAIIDNLALNVVA